MGEDRFGNIGRVEIGGKLAYVLGRGERACEDAAYLRQDLLRPATDYAVAVRQLDGDVSERAAVVSIGVTWL